jgi:hypothetical protein
MAVKVLVRAKLAKERYLTRFALHLQRWLRTLPAVRRYKRFRRAVVVLQSHCRRKLAAREVALRRLVARPRLLRLLSQRRPLCADARGRLTHLLPVVAEAEGGNEAASSSGSPLAGPKTKTKTALVVQLEALLPSQKSDIGKAIAPAQAFMRWLCFNVYVLRIQRRWRGCFVRGQMRKRHAAATYIQSIWRRCLVMKQRGMTDNAVSCALLPMR